MILKIEEKEDGQPETQAGIKAEEYTRKKLKFMLTFGDISQSESHGEQSLVLCKGFKIR